MYQNTLTMAVWLLAEAAIMRSAAKPLPWGAAEYRSIRTSPKITHRRRLPWYTVGFE